MKKSAYINGIQKAETGNAALVHLDSFPENVMEHFQKRRPGDWKHGEVICHTESGDEIPPFVMLPINFTNYMKIIPIDSRFTEWDRLIIGTELHFKIGRLVADIAIDLKEGRVTDATLHAAVVSMRKVQKYYDFLSTVKPAPDAMVLLEAMENKMQAEQAVDKLLGIDQPPAQNRPA